MNLIIVDEDLKTERFEYSSKEKLESDIKSCAKKHLEKVRDGKNIQKEFHDYFKTVQKKYNRRKIVPDYVADKFQEFESKAAAIHEEITESGWIVSDVNPNQRLWFKRFYRYPTYSIRAYEDTHEGMTSLVDYLVAKNA